MIDLPGHGLSNWTDDMSVYSFIGFAHAIMRLVNYLKIKKFIWIGWSLGGQIGHAIKFYYPERLYYVIESGAPSVSDKDLMEGFKFFAEAIMMGQIEQFTREEAEIFNKAAGNPNWSMFVLDAMNTDGRARHHMIASSTTGGGVDAKSLAKTYAGKVFIVIGTNDKGVNNDFIRSLGNGIIIEVETNHATFFWSPETFHKILDENATLCK
jgi:pimeloyl-ACP methyl ester carboxylesterase